MNDQVSFDPEARQVLVNLGNRFVVFGPEPGLPERPRFDPTDAVPAPRAADENEFTESQIVETLQVAGMTRSSQGGIEDAGADLALIDSSGKHIYVDVKIRERDPRQRDFAMATSLLEGAASRHRIHEVWFLNVERLKLTIIRQNENGIRYDELVPLNVWTRSAEGVFERRQVIAEVDDWVRRIDTLYEEVQRWLADQGQLRCERARTVTMSEELMQQFAVTDRDLPVLDVIKADQVIASFVPRGLWLIGAWGKIDLITRDATATLIAIRNGNEFEWKLGLAGDRTALGKFNRASLLRLIGDK